MKERSIKLDALRGFAILLVVMGHAIAWSYMDWHDVCLFKQDQPTNFKVGGVVWQLIYSFHMALFFLISGYLSGLSSITKSNIIDKIKNKTIRLFIPYLSTGYLIFIVRGNWGYWFLLTLFEISILWMVIYVLLAKINADRKIWIDVVIMGVMYLTLRVIFYVLPVTSVVIDSNILKYFIPFCFGALIKRHQLLMKMVLHSKCFTFCLLFFSLLFISRYLTSYPIIYQLVEKLDFFFSIMTLSACVVFFHIFMKGINAKLESLFAYLGRLSMPIYILHNLFVLQIVAVGNYILQQNAVTSITLQLCYSFIVSVISISFSLLLYLVLHRSNLVRILMFGEK